MVCLPKLVWLPGKEGLTQKVRVMWTHGRFSELRAENLVRDRDSVTLTECLNHCLRFAAPNLLFSLLLITNRDSLVSWQHTNAKQKKKSLAVMILKGRWRFLSWRYLDEFSNQRPGLHELPGPLTNPKVLRRAIQKPRLLANFSKHEKDTSPTVGNRK